MAISDRVREGISASLWAINMFDYQLKNISGTREIYDFRLGNPAVEPPQIFFEELKRVVNNPFPGMHRYTPLAGYTETREAVAKIIAKQSGLSFSTHHVIMTAGATAALNIILKAILNPGEEVIILAPHFVEYPYYIDNHNGVCRTADTNSDFTVNIDNIAAKINSNTRAIIINSPNNPTGQVYSEKSLEEIARLLNKKSHELKRDIYLISDEAYRYIVYDDNKVPDLFRIYKNTVVAASYSKQLSIPGERVGYAAVNPEIENVNELIEAIIFANRILGYLCAPATVQKVITRLQGVCVDIGEYIERRDIFCNALESFGYSFIKPKGTYYIFPKSPVDDLDFTKELSREGILVNPGRNFGRNGYFRIAFCVGKETIEKSLEGFKKVKELFRPE